MSAASRAASGGTPLMHCGLGQLSNAAGAAGGTPLMQSGSLQLTSVATGGVPLMHFGSGQLVSAASAGGGPPLHFGMPLHALAAVVDRANEPAITAAKTTVCPNSLRICIVTMIQPFDLRSPHVTSCFRGYRDIQR